MAMHLQLENDPFVIQQPSEKGGGSIAKRAEVIAALQHDILRLQGFRSVNSQSVDAGLGPIVQAFPNGSFPLGTIHEFLSSDAATLAATTGFLAGLLATISSGHGTLLWISSCRTLFPPALARFGLRPDQIIFIDLSNEKDILWVMDEALKCGALTAVVGEMQDISFTASRRLQLAVEQSQVTGFIVRRNPRRLNTTACVSRWRIASLPSEPVDGLPGLGFPHWQVELLRVRNGKPGTWEFRWVERRFEQVVKLTSSQHQLQKKAG